MATPTQVSWRDEIERGVIPKVVPRDEWEAAQREVAKMLLACSGCAADPPTIAGEKQPRPPSRTGNKQNLVGHRFLFDGGAVNGFEDAGDGLFYAYLEQVTGTIEDGGCHVVDGECVEETKCKWNIEWKFKAQNLDGGAFPTVTIDPPHGASAAYAPHSVVTLPDGSTEARYTVYSTIEPDCGTSVDDTIDMTDFTFTAAGWTFTPFDGGAEPFKIRFTCWGCQGGEEEPA